VPGSQSVSHRELDIDTAFFGGHFDDQLAATGQLVIRFFDLGSAFLIGPYLTEAGVANSIAGPVRRRPLPLLATVHDAHDDLLTTVDAGLEYEGLFNDGAQQDLLLPSLCSVFLRLAVVERDSVAPAAEVPLPRSILVDLTF
jgi:hypothetical protein